MQLIHIVDTDQDMWIDTDVFFQQSEMELTQWRSRLRERYKRNKNNPHFICAWCQSAVILARRMDHMEIKGAPTFFFKHVPELENNPEFQCPVKHIKQLSEQDVIALKYKCAKESNQHKLLKENIYQSLHADSAFSDLQIEQVRKSIDLTQWRRPDVSALYGNQLMVFEGQLSTTFLNVMIDRKIFYQDNNACLLWIFNKFEPTEKIMKQSMQDTYYNNNANAFVVNELTVSESIKEKAFFLECNYLRPEIKDSKIVNTWNKKLVSFHELIRNDSTKQIFFFDYESEYRRLKKKLDLPQSYLQESHDNEGRLKVRKYHEALGGREAFNVPLRSKSELLTEFNSLWISAIYLTDNQFNIKWFAIRSELEKLGIDAPRYILHAPFKTVINSILSAKSGFVVGSQLNDMLSVAHNLMEHHPEYIKHFLLTLKVTGKPDLLKERDRSGKWNARYGAYIRQPEELKNYRHDLNKFIEFLVPEFDGRLASWGKK